MVEPNRIVLCFSAAIPKKDDASHNVTLSGTITVISHRTTHCSHASKDRLPWQKSYTLDGSPRKEGLSLGLWD